MNGSNLIRSAVIGVGYLGKYHAEKYAMLPGASLVGVADVNQENAVAIARKLDVEAYTDYRNLIGKVDAVSIVTPTKLHHKVAKTFLENGIHVLVEKPITVTIEEAQDLIDTAKQNQCILQVGHLERFNAAWLDMAQVIKQPKFIESHRLAPYNPRAKDVDVILDLMIHDIDIILATVRSEIVDLVVSGTPVISDQTDIANARLTFASGCVANVTASRISLKVERKMRVFQNDAYISIDFQNRVFSFHQKGSGEMFPGVPNIVSKETAYQNGDALKSEIEAFIDCVVTGKPPLVTGEDGLLALKTANQLREILNSQKEVISL